MKIFNHFNATGDITCPVCKTNEDKQTVLLPIIGSNKNDSMNYEAIQVHLDCLNLSCENLNLSPNKIGYIFFQVVDK